MKAIRLSIMEEVPQKGANLVIYPKSKMGKVIQKSMAELFVTTLRLPFGDIGIESVVLQNTIYFCSFDRGGLAFAYSKAITYECGVYKGDESKSALSTKRTALQKLEKHSNF